jgi:hypothetical protein
MKTWNSVCAVSLLTFSVAVAQADEPKTEQRMVGRITSIRPADRVVVVQPRKGPEVVLTADDKSQLQLDQKDVTLKEFAEGMRVRAVYVTSGGVNRIVALTDPLLTTNKVARAITDAFDTAKNYSFQEKAKYEQQLQPVLNDLDERINEVAEQAAEAAPGANQQLQRDLAELRQRREIVQDKLKRVEAATPAAWDDVKAGIHAAIDDLRTGIDRARSRTK